MFIYAQLLYLDAALQYRVGQKWTILKSLQLCIWCRRRVIHKIAAGNYVKCPCNNFIKRYFNQYFVNNNNNNYLE